MKIILNYLVFILLCLNFAQAKEKPLMMFNESKSSNTILNNPNSISINTNDSNLVPLKTHKNTKKAILRLSVKGQGVAPNNTLSPAQAYALAKRAAITDGYRLLAEKIKGVQIEGRDLIKNAMVTRSEIRTQVDALISKATIIETTFSDGLCEVEMELIIDKEEWEKILAQSSSY